MLDHWSLWYFLLQDILFLHGANLIFPCFLKPRSTGYSFPTNPLIPSSFLEFTWDHFSIDLPFHPPWVFGITCDPLHLLTLDLFSWFPSSHSPTNHSPNIPLLQHLHPPLHAALGFKTCNTKYKCYHVRSFVHQNPTLTWPLVPLQITPCVNITFIKINCTFLPYVGSSCVNLHSLGFETSPFLINVLQKTLVFKVNSL